MPICVLCDILVILSSTSITFAAPTTSSRTYDSLNRFIPVVPAGLVRGTSKQEEEGNALGKTNLIHEEHYADRAKALEQDLSPYLANSTSPPPSISAAVTHPNLSVETHPSSSSSSSSSLPSIAPSSTAAKPP